MWYVRSEGQWKLMFTFMQTALDDAWEKAAGNYDEFRTNSFRFNVPSDEDSYYKVYCSTFKQYRYYSPTQKIVKCCRFTWWDDERFPGGPPEPGSGPATSATVDSAAESNSRLDVEDSKNDDDLLNDIVDVAEQAESMDTDMF